MPAKVLTDAAVRRLKPAGRRREVPDARAAGLHLVIQPSGSKAWALRFRRPDGRNAKLTLGPVDFSGRELAADPVIGMPLTLQAARLLAADVHRQRRLGRDVVSEHTAAKRRRRIESEQAGASAFGVLLRQFVAEHMRPNVRRWQEVARVLGLAYPIGGGDPAETKNGLAERWADKPVAAIDGQMIYMAIDEARRHGVPGLGRRNKGLSDARGRKVARALSKLFGWLVEHRKLTADPTLGMWCPPAPASRERVLSPAEVRWFWQASGSVGPPFGAMAKMLLLCGSRREEVRAMTRSEVTADGVTWSIPGSRTKNRRPHQVPLSPLAREVLASVPRVEGGAGLVFTLDGERAIAGIAKCKERLDRAMLEAARAERGEGAPIPPWRLHDLRRTLVTGLIELGVAPHVVELCVNHVSGTRAGIAGIYNKAEMLSERRTALERWAAHVQGLVSDAATNVVPMPRKGA